MAIFKKLSNLISFSKIFCSKNRVLFGLVIDENVIYSLLTLKTKFGILERNLIKILGWGKRLNYIQN
jgi:hypothetical protein